MNNIKTPAYRLTADCIWNTFRSSKKRHLLLTGSRHSGKTTLLCALQRLIREAEPQIPAPFPGVTTQAVPKHSVFLQENCSGRQMQIGIYDPALPGSSQKMRPCLEGFTSLGVSALQRCMDISGSWVSIDEIGYLEAHCKPYQDALLTLLEKKQLLASVRKQELPFLHRLCHRPDVCCIDLDEPFGDCGCVIMASGLGTRFGGNKLLADFCGRPLLSCILDATEQLFSKRVMVTRHPQAARLCQDREVTVLLHDKPFRSDTIRLGLSALGNVENCMFCPGDQPLLKQATIASLLLAARQDPQAIWRPVCGHTAGSPVLFPAWAFPELLSLPDKKGGGYLIKKYPEYLRHVSIRDAYELMDIDYPADLQVLSGR